MINLLPPFGKKKLKEQIRFKIFFHFLILIIFSLLSLFLLLSIISFFLEGEISRIQFLLGQKEKFIEKEMKNKILEKNRLLKELISFEKEKKEFLPFIEKIFNGIPAGVSLETVSFQLEKNGKIKTTIFGKAEKRENLINLKNFLEENFSETFFPATVWLKEENVDFSVTFKEK